MTKAKAKTNKRDLAGEPISLAARYDAAATTRRNARHWSYADFKSADLDASKDVRKTLRIRARYETQNNSYARGIAYTVAADTVGTGPHLQVVGADDAARRIEHDWAEWAKAVSLTEKLRVARYTKLVDGEAFLLLTSNEAIAHDIKIDVQLIDADRVTSDTGPTAGNLRTDGVTLDRKGNVLSYSVLDRHPSEGASGNPSVIPAKYIVHLFDVLRPGQNRGVSELAPCIELFGQLRAYTSAVITAAQTAACLTGVIQTDAPAGGEAVPIEPMEQIDLAAGQLLTMPAGWELSMTKAEQPTASYAAFKAEVLGEISRCMQVPYNIAVGNSNNASYASSRLDWQIYHKSITLQQKMLADHALDRIFEMWLVEWGLANGGRPDIEHAWIWDGINEHSDPYKEAHANDLELKNCTSSLSTIYAQKGKNWETEIRQIAREREALQALGLSIGAAAPKPIEEDEENHGNEDRS